MIKITVYSDKDIKKAIDEEKIGLEPLDNEVQIQPASVDLTLGSKYKKYSNHYFTLDTSDASVEMDDFTAEDSITLQPNEFCLATTEQYLVLPDDMIARVEGRSSLGRLRVAIHVTAGFIDPGFERQITLELKNQSPIPITLHPGQRVCQIVFEDLSSPAELPYGTAALDSKYQGQEGPVASKLDEDSQ